MQQLLQPHRPASRLRLLALSTSLALALVACGGGGSEDITPAESGSGNGSENSASNDPLHVYKTQTLNWTACNNSALQVVTKMQCTSFAVPLDYADPGKGDIKLQAKRIPAMSAQRKGAIFFNPGGPGGEGLNNGLVLLVQIMKQPGVSQQMQKLQAQLVSEYDLLGFNPRGTSTDSPLTCASDTDQVAEDYSSTARNRPGNFEAMSANLQADAQACQANPLSAYISTDATARDMYLLRHLMGDNKISYLGYSYGTWLGAWYGRLFPERVDRMVLDSNADVSAEHMDFNEYQSIARDTIINEVLAPYAARHAATYDLGFTTDEVRQNLANIDPLLKTTFAYKSGAFYSSATTPESMIGLSATKGLDQILRNHPAANPIQIRNAIDAYQFVPMASIIANYQVRLKAHELLNLYDNLKSDASNLGQPKEKTKFGPDDEGGNSAVFLSVLCNDSAPPSRDPSYWKTLGDTIAQKAPFFGGSNPVNQACMYWNTPNIQRPPFSSLQSLDVLMVQSQYDGATPTPGAMKGFAALPKAHMIYVTDEYQHGVFPYNTTCVDVPVLQYLLGQSPNWRQMNCSASGNATPLDGNNMAFKSTGSSVSSNDLAEEVQRRELINKFKENIGHNLTQ